MVMPKNQAGRSIYSYNMDQYDMIQIAILHTAWWWKDKTNICENVFEVQIFSL